MKSVLAVVCAACASGAAADIQLLSNEVVLNGEAKGGGVLNPACIGPLTETSDDPFNNLPFIQESTGSVVATTDTGQFAGTGSGLTRATVSSSINTGSATLFTGVQAEGRFSASGSLGMGLGYARSVHVIRFTPTVNTPYTLNAELLAITPGYAPTDVVRITENGSPIHLIDESNPSEIVGFAGTFLSGAVYEIRIDLEEFVSGMAGDIPIQGRSSAEVDLAFEPGTVILAPVDCPADVNGDGAATPADFTAWLACFQDPTSAPFCANADVNGDGSIDPADFTAWLASFNAGCP